MGLAARCHVFAVKSTGSVFYSVYVQAILDLCFFPEELGTELEFRMKNGFHGETKFVKSDITKEDDIKVCCHFFYSLFLYISKTEPNNKNWTDNCNSNPN